MSLLRPQRDSVSPQVSQVWPAQQPAAPAGGVMFIDGKPERKRGINAVTSQQKYSVRAPFRIVIDGTVYTGGDSLTLPDDERTRFWRRARWIEAQPSSEKETTQ